MTRTSSRSDRETGKTASLLPQTFKRERPLSAYEREVLIDALASALVDDYRAAQQALTDSPGESPGGTARTPEAA